MSTHVFDDSIFNSRFSLRPLYEAMKKNISQGNPGAEQLYGGMIEQIDAQPELLDPVEDFASLEPHRDLINAMLSTVFPPTAHINDGLFAVSFPFKFHAIYASRYFETLLLVPGTRQVNIPENLIGDELVREKIMNAYRLILKKYFNYAQPELITTVYPFLDPASGLTKYMELEVDTRFIEVNPVGDLPRMPENVICHRTNRVMSLEDLRKHIPLDKFIFDGMAIIRIKEVTEQEIINLIKNDLLSVDAFSDLKIYSNLQQHIQNLLGLNDIRIGITPFFKVNGHYVYSEIHNSNSLLHRELAELKEKDLITDCCVDLFQEKDFSVVFEKLTEKDFKEFEYLELYRKYGARSLILCPLRADGELIGVLEISSQNEGELKHHHIGKLKHAIPLFILALKKSAEGLINQVDKVIKEKFTAVQPAVEWKFTDTALDFISARQKDENAKIGRIAFDNVYPLYGAVDIRNSSTERAHAIQLDLIEQLQTAQAIIRKAQGETFFPLLQEIEFKIEKYISSATDTLLSEEEMVIQDFLQNKVIQLFEHLKSNVPAVAHDIDAYFAMLNPQLHMVYNHRKDYEESIAHINESVARFVDREQVSAQKVFPHYFERYVTDGVEFNVYIGQSIAPKKKFDELYLRNMKMWQLSTLAKAARLTRQLERELAHPLKTTQLILAHSIPISISFRTAERKFDVDGAYNIRYEIIKKRIDKVRIKASGERLTQPDKIAIVYSQPKEAAEYKEYIEFLQNQKLLKPGIEEMELEELQGVIGLKAMRVEINYDTTPQPDPKIELSNTTSDKLLGRS